MLSFLAVGDLARAEDRVLRRVDRADKLVRQAAGNVGALQAQHPECTAKALAARTPAAYLCKIRLLTQESGSIEIPADQVPTKNRPLQRRLELGIAANELGDAVAAFKPVNAGPDLPAQKFQAKALGCGVLGALYDSLTALPSGSPAASALSGDKSLPAGLGEAPFKDTVCACTQEAARLGDAAFLAPSDELAAVVKRSLYSRGCFLDVKAGGTSLVEVQRDSPGAAPGVKLPGQDPEERSVQIRTIATSRDFQLNRCRERFGGRRIDLKQMETCVCGVVAKWRFPKKEGPAVEVTLPVIEKRASSVLSVSDDGSVASCQVKSDG